MAKPKPDNAAQSKRFLETAGALPDGSKAFDQAMSKLAPVKAPAPRK